MPFVIKLFNELTSLEHGLIRARNEPANQDKTGDPLCGAFPSGKRSTYGEGT